MIFLFPMATFWAMVIVYYVPPGNISLPSLPVSALLNFPFRGILPKCYGYFCILWARLHVSGSDSSCSSPIFHKHFSEFTEAREITYFTTCLDCIFPPFWTGVTVFPTQWDTFPALPSWEFTLPAVHPSLFSMIYFWFSFTLFGYPQPTQGYIKEVSFFSFA